ncbi:MAG TPA: hypothetical protein VHT74_08355, partial [Acetobacteraceae bacterium]|nr:hypothetical protein [Acetobacteraceae bacterium]
MVLTMAAGKRSPGRVVRGRVEEEKVTRNEKGPALLPARSRVLWQWQPDRTCQRNARIVEALVRRLAAVALVLVGR